VCSFTTGSIKLSASHRFFPEGTPAALSIGFTGALQSSVIQSTLTFLSVTVALGFWAVPICCLSGHFQRHRASIYYNFAFCYLYQEAFGCEQLQINIHYACNLVYPHFKNCTGFSSYQYQQVRMKGVSVLWLQRIYVFGFTAVKIILGWAFPVKGFSLSLPILEMLVSLTCFPYARFINST
jgi:hypothetical protein